MAERGRPGSLRSASSDGRPSSEPRRKPPIARLKDCCRTTIAFVFSNVGVCVLMVGYNIMGAFLFKSIEGPSEEMKQYFVGERRNATVERLWNHTMAFNNLYPNNWTLNVAREVCEYKKFIVEVVGEGYDGTDGPEKNIMWSFEGGFLYSLTVITTIGKTQPKINLICKSRLTTRFRPRIREFNPSCDIFEKSVSLSHTEPN